MKPLIGLAVGAAFAAVAGPAALIAVPFLLVMIALSAKKAAHYERLEAMTDEQRLAHARRYGK